MRTQGQIEDTLGVGPRETRAYIVHDLIIIRLKSKLLPIEEKLLEGTRGVELVKDIRKSLHEITTAGMSTIIKNITGHTVISSHSDISTIRDRYFYGCKILVVFCVGTFYCANMVYLHTP